MQLRPLRLGKSRKARQFTKLIPFISIIAVLTFLAIFLTTLSGSNSVIDLVFSSSNLKSTNDRINILLLGIAGGVHAGSNLTDTIMVASYDLKTNQVYLFSIPRDLWMPALKSKANAIYQIGLSQSDGLGLTKTVMGNVLGVPIHFSLRVDFRGFVQAIDAIDGIDMVVDKSFDDYLYPSQGKEDDLCGSVEKEMEFSEEDAKKLNITPGKKTVLITKEGQIATDSAEEDKGIKYFSCRYEHISFDKGETHMGGAVALAFVRSRHGTNEEGSDFARSKRQQKVLEAAKNKILSLETLANAQKVTELVKALGKSIDTDISVKEAIELYKLSRKLAKINSFVLDDSLLYHPPASDYGGAYVLVSQDDDFSIVQRYVRKVFSGEITEHEQSSNPRIEEATSAARSR